MGSISASIEYSIICSRCETDLSKASTVIYMSGLPVCPVCLNQGHDHERALGGEMKISEEKFLKMLENAHMAGQRNQGVDPSYYEAAVYSSAAMENEKTSCEHR